MDLDETLRSEGWRDFYEELTKTTILIPPPVLLEFVPHKDAPMFSDRDKSIDLINHVLENWAEVVRTDEGVDIIRQACLVNLWFFLKYVGSYNGPYGDLTDHLHIDMCNYRQRQLHAGARGGCFISRSMFKSTVMTHGALTWELLRDPNLRIGLCSSKAEMSEEFMHVVQKNFESNELIRTLFPDHCPSLHPETGEVTQPNWTMKKMIMPNRTKQLQGPSIKCIGALASAQGNHFDLLAIDDLVGEKQLNSQHSASEEMIKITNWLNSNQDTLLVSPKSGRVFIAATRYAVDDAYEQLFQDCKEMVGFWDEVPYKINPDGVWSIYYRMAVEKDRLIFPEKVDQKFLDRLKRNNPWSYFTQYLNNPYDAQTNEFSNYKVRECELDYTTAQGFTINYFSGGEHRKVRLADCEVNIGIDPAASEVRVSARTSRTAIVVRARDWNDKRYYIDGITDYITPSAFYEKLFRLYDKYKDYVDSTNLEAHGGFKYVLNSLREEQQKRKKWLNLRQIVPLPDKDAKLRNFVQPLLDSGLIYAAHPIRQVIEEEIMTFPGGTKRDTLDAMEIADRFSIKPQSATEMAAEEARNSNYRGRVRNKAGY